jgi:ribosome-associated protein
MDIRKLQRCIVDGLEDVKGQNIMVFDTEHLSALFERVIIASGTSNRQTKALAASVRDAVKEGGFGSSRTEGEANGEWIIVDCGAAVVHLMQPTIREYYRLEEIWGDKPVKMKIDNAPVRLVKASEAETPAAIKKETSKKAAAKKVATKKVAAKAEPENKPAAKKVAAKKATPVKTTASKTVAKAPARKTAAPLTAVAKRAAAKRAAPVKTGITRTAGVKTATKTATKTPMMVVAPTKKVMAKQAADKKAPPKRKVATQSIAKRAAPKK